MDNVRSSVPKMLKFEIISLLHVYSNGSYSEKTLSIHIAEKR